MCGILGILSPSNEKYNRKYFKKTVDKLFKLSESRGRESSGLALLCDGEIKVYKKPSPASELLKDDNYKKLFKVKKFQNHFVLGHTRLATNGDFDSNANNQPVIKDDIVGIHNGIITNSEELWKKNKDLKKRFTIDTEIFLSLVHKGLKKGLTIIDAVNNVYRQIEGAASIGLMFSDLGVNVLATNTGSLYYILSENNDILIFASEFDILFSLLKKNNLNNYFNKTKITQLLPRNGLLIHQGGLKLEKFSFDKDEKPKKQISATSYPIFDLSIYQEVLPQKQNKPIISKLTKDFDRNLEKIKKLHRCTKCILPETIPYIEFDKDGICNYCRNYRKIKVYGRQELERYLEKYRKNNGKPDVLVTFSGGRDSSYALHYFKKELKMNPVAYSYDWGMLTDLGRRNQSLMTAKLGVEHILISADIKKKRENIRKNIVAWLKKPDLGTVPLFMAGDKQYFYYANKLGRQMGINLIVLGINPLEKTDFKFGFCGIKPDENVTYRLNLYNKMKLAGYYSKEYLTNPNYINSSLMDTLFAYFAYYLIPHEYLSFYEYIYWDESRIEKTLLNDYNWEMANDTKTTWRIGDGTAPFYNYIYYTMAGFTENDTFRSNQIREGVIKREDALKLSEAENKPRYESMQWYADTIGLDLEESLKIINKAPKLF